MGIKSIQDFIHERIRRAVQPGLRELNKIV